MAGSAVLFGKGTMQDVGKPFGRIRRVRFMATGAPDLLKNLILVRRRYILIGVAPDADIRFARFQIVLRHFMTVACRCNVAAIQMAGKATLIERIVLELLFQCSGDRGVTFEADAVHTFRLRLG